MAEQKDFNSSLKALSVFQTMRANLAMCVAFSRRSVLEYSDYDEEDLGFLATPPGPEQIRIHNDAILKIHVALMAQVLDNYLEMKRIRPRLEDPDVEAYLSGLGDRCRFVAGMTRIRNAVFHVKSLRSWRDRDIVYLIEMCRRRGGVDKVMRELRGLLYAFTEKCFKGDLKIHPLEIHYEMEKADRRMREQHPELAAKFDRGEIGLLEYLDQRGVLDWTRD